MTRPSKRRQQLRENAIRARTARQAAPLAVNLVDLESSEEYVSNDSDTESQFTPENEVLEVDDFELNSDEHACTIIDLLLAASKKSFEKRERPFRYRGDSKRTKRRKRQNQREAAKGTPLLSQFFLIDNDNENGDDELQYSDRADVDSEGEDEDGHNEREKTIREAIDFVEKVIQKELLSNAQKVRYTAVLYFLRLVLSGVKKIKASQEVANIFNGGIWRAKLIRKWANICLKRMFLFFMFFNIIKIKSFSLNKRSIYSTESTRKVSFKKSST